MVDRGYWRLIEGDGGWLGVVRGVDRGCLGLMVGDRGWWRLIRVDGGSSKSMEYDRLYLIYISERTRLLRIS